ncbi:MAG: hypothetical protein RLY78_517 [Pseudomonadota bacterium]|jgi:LacI family transcriptional regulator|uniref:LacI family DNA-binding transcriptional regulator n=1 Tax=Pseudaquabacterium rugosum TaxID=2984194 RepID=A0ABU9BDG5_9BURK
MPRPTLRDVATAAGVSLATVNRVLAEPHKVREATRLRVTEAARTIGFHGAGLLARQAVAARPRLRLGVLVQTPHRPFTHGLRQALEDAAAAWPGAQLQLRVDVLDDLGPEQLAERLQALADTVDALGLVVAEHPIVGEAIARLIARGQPVIALVTPLSGPQPVPYVGLDGWKIGRMAGWTFGHLCRTPGPLGILVGTHRYRNQELAESGLRSWLREHGDGFTLLEPRSTFESDAIAREMTEALLRRHPDLCGLYVAGGGVSGMLAAVRDSGRAGQLVTVGHELLPAMRAGLIDGSLSLAIAHPFAALAQAAIGQLVAAVQGDSATAARSVIVPMEIHTRETL